MSDVERQRAHFERVSETYFRARQDPSHLLLKRLLWAHALRDRDGLVAPGSSVLEAMCGYSEGKAILEARYGPCFSYSGFDYSRPLVERARSLHPGDDLFVADATRFEPRRQHDLVIVLGGLHHVYAHVADVLARLAAALRPGGAFVSLEPTHANPVFRAARERIYARNALFDAETERAFEVDELNGLFRGAGLEIVDQLYPGLLAYVLYYNPDAFPALMRGGEAAVRWLFRAESPFYRTWLARKLSFATLTLLRKPPA